MDDTWTKIQNKITADTDLNKRQDDTAALLYWDDVPYELVKPDGKTKLKDAISVTPNLPKVFTHGVVSDLLSGKWQTVIEGGIPTTQAHIVESFINDNFAQADELLLEEQGIPSLDGWLCNHVCVRWAIGVQWMTWIEKGEYKIHCVPVDMRWTPFVRNRWVAPITFRKKDDLEQELEEYEKRAKAGGGEYFKTSIGTDPEVRDYWDTEKNELWVDRKLVFRQKNKLGYPPFVIVTPASGFMLRDKGYLKHQGEDVLFLSAGLHKEFARSVSLEQTSGYAGLYPAYEKERKTYTGEPSQPVPELDESLDVREGERHQPVPRGDINKAGQTARADIQEMISVGAPLSPRQYNTPPSAVLLAGETEMISRLQNARKDALGIMRSGLARRIVGQAIKLGKGELLIGKQGKRTKYYAQQLGNPDDYAITYHLSVKSKRQELANLAEFVAAYDKLPLEWSLPNILMADDPAGIIRQLKMQKAKSVNPALDFLEMGLDFLTEADEMEDGIEADIKREQAKIMAHEYVMAMRQRTQPMPTATPREAKGNTQLLSALGGAAGAMRGEAVKQPEEIVA